MKVLHVITDLTVGGAETVLARLLARMDRSAFQPMVISLGEGGSVLERLRADGIDVRTANRSLRKMHREARSFRPDLIQGWMYHGNIAAYLESCFSPGRVPLCWNIRHSLDDLKIEKRRIAFLIRLGALLSYRPDRIVYNSMTGSRQHENAGYKKERSVVISNGFDLDEFKPSRENRISVRAELGLPDDAILIGLFARYHRVKDHETFLAAASLIQRAGIQATFLLAGRDIEVSNINLRKQIQDAGISARVHCLGQRQDIPRLTSALDVSVCSSSSESFPNIVGEAMACGISCVSTDVGDVRLLMGDTGRIVSCRNPKEMADAVIGILQASGDERKRNNDAARQRIEQEFSIDRMIRSYERLYNELAVA